MMVTEFEAGQQLKNGSWAAELHKKRSHEIAQDLAEMPSEYRRN